jgi:copper homeostasis protein
MVEQIRQPVLLEVCVGSVEDSLAAAAGGADRLELNCALALGGLTPSLGTLAEVKRSVHLPVIQMVRPRAGGFAYSDAEFRVMQRDLNVALENGADGIALGMLTDSGDVDKNRCRELLKQVGDKYAVFHRAFDVTPKPQEALEQLIDLGFRRLMTSGQEQTALQGVRLIAELMDRARGRIEILPAGGINRHTVAELVHRTRVNQVHASLRMRRSDPTTPARVSCNSAIPLEENVYEATDSAAVAELRALLAG